MDPGVRQSRVRLPDDQPYGEVRPGNNERVLTVRLRMIKGLVVKEAVVAEAKKADQLFQEKKYPEARVRSSKRSSPKTRTPMSSTRISANSFFAEENYEEAIKAYMKVLKRRPKGRTSWPRSPIPTTTWATKAEAAKWYGKLSVGDVQDIDTAYNAGVCLYNAGSTDSRPPSISRNPSRSTRRSPTATTSSGWPRWP